MTGIAEQPLLESRPEAVEQVLLSVRNLGVGFGLDDGHRQVVQGVSFDLAAGGCTAIVGESGSGKSVTARSIVGLTGERAVVTADRLSLDGVDLRSVPAAQWRRIRGDRIGFILQDALVSLDPLRPVGAEIEEALRLHGWKDRPARRAKTIDLLDSVGVPDPQIRARQRPGELSGGLRQRALIASAVAADPRLIIADEPTTALDVTVQAQVLDLLGRLKRRGAAILLISHDLSVVAHLADRILVMNRGRVVESGSAEQVLREPTHEYTRRLIAAVPGPHTRGRRLSADPELAARRDERRGAPAAGRVGVSEVAAGQDGGASGAARPVGVAPAADRADGPVLEATGLVKRFVRPDGSPSTAVDGVSFRLGRGETLGIVGESGSGKSTTARLALALTTPDEGAVTLFGAAWSAQQEEARRPLRARIAAVYQDPLSSFDPRWNVERILTDAVPADAFPGRAARRERVEELLAQVGLDGAVLARFPLRLSGGQRQRVAIARALASSPSIIVLDEAVSALDVSVQAQVLDLLTDLQERLGLSYLFISHDLGVIRHISDRVLVMKDGRVVESGPTEEVFTRPREKYTSELVAAAAALGR